MQTAFAVPIRNKAKWGLEQCVRQVLAQSYSPMDIFFSDQGSEDDSLALVRKLVDGYNGPNRIYVLQCPDTDPVAMCGLNAHYNWLMNQIDADFIMWSSADDFPVKERSARTMTVMNEHDGALSYIGTMQRNFGPDGKYKGDTARPDKTQICDLAAIAEQRLGGSMSSAWRSDLWEKFGPLPAVGVQDLLVPFWAGLDRGMFYISEPLQIRTHWDDPNQTGLQDIMESTTDLAYRKQMEEITHFQMCANHIYMAQAADKVAQQNPARYEEIATVIDKLMHTVLGHTAGWVETRTWLTERKIVPLCFQQRRN